MGDDLDILIGAAEARGAELVGAEPRAAAAHFDPDTRSITVGLTSGCAFTFPAHLVPELADAESDALSDVEILGRGIGLHWEALDVDLSVPGLLAGLFGTRAWLDRQRASRAGAARSAAKIAAARANGRKGGRPRKAGGNPTE